MTGQRIALFFVKYEAPEHKDQHHDQFQKSPFPFDLGTIL